MSVLDRFKTVHIWIGQIEQTEEEYDKYFEGYYNQETEVYYNSQFDKDICPTDDDYCYDEDFIGIIPLLEKSVTIQELLDLAVVDDQDEPKVIADCKKIGLEKGNAIVFYSDNTLDLRQPKENYNGLKYIGHYKADSL